MTNTAVELDSREKLEQHLNDNKPLTNCEFQALDLTLYQKFAQESLADSVFLGCMLTPEALVNANKSGAIIFPRPKKDTIPYDTFRSRVTPFRCWRVPSDPNHADLVTDQSSRCGSLQNLSGQVRRFRFTRFCLACAVALNKNG